MHDKSRALRAKLIRPRVKPEHSSYRTSDGNVRIGSVVYGIGAEVEDPDGWVWTLTLSMDGSRSSGEVVSRVTEAHPDLSEDEVLSAIAELYDAGFVEDAAAPIPAEISKRDQERYGRGVNLLRWMDRSPRRSTWELQLRLKRARVLLIGMGGAGGATAQALVASGVGLLHCIDPDAVELSNLNRQTLYRESDIGRPKADAALTALRSLNSDVEVRAERLRVHGPEDIEALLDAATPGGGFDLLVMAADDPPEIRRWTNRVCLSRGLAWTEGGYRGPCVSIGVFVPGRGSCWECHRAGDAEQRDLRLPSGADPESASPRMPWSPVNAVSAGLTGNLLAHAALVLLTGSPPLEPGYRFGVNLVVPGDSVMERYPQRSDCPACGG